MKQLAMFRMLKTEELNTKQKLFLCNLPQQIQTFLKSTNGAKFEEYQYNFYTNIPYKEKNPLQPYLTDHLLQILGFDPEGKDDWDDIQAFNSDPGLSLFPKGVLTFGRCQLGALGVSLNEFDFGKIYYNRTHFQSVEYHFRDKTNAVYKLHPDMENEDAKLALAYAGVEKIANSFVEFMNGFIQEEVIDDPELELLSYNTNSEQYKRISALHNLLVLFGNSKDVSFNELMTKVAGGFIDKSFLEEQRKEAPTSGHLLIVNNSVADSMILDWMIDALMLEQIFDKNKYRIVVFFAKNAGYPKTETDHSISDYYARKEREKNRQMPPLDVVMQDSRECALAIVQSLYLTGIAGGDVSPAQDQTYARIAGQNRLIPEELHYIVRKRENLDLLLPKFEGWNELLKKELIQFLKLDGGLSQASVQQGIRLFELMGLPKAELLAILKIKK